MLILDLNKQNTLAIKDLVDMNGDLNYNILGEDKRETKKLNRIFFKNNSKLNVFNYPKERGKA